MGGRRGPDYEGIRAPPARFAVLPGHVDWKVERVTNSADSRYEVVEKIERVRRSPSIWILAAGG